MFCMPNLDTQNKINQKQRGAYEQGILVKWRYIQVYMHTDEVNCGNKCIVY